MGTRAGARLGAHGLRSSLSKCRLHFIRAMKRYARREEGFMAVEIESDGILEYAPFADSKEAIVHDIQLREIRTFWKMLRRL
jgi:hypothetical protein